MATRLAKLDDLKALIRGSAAPSDQLDGELTTMIERASAIADDLVGRPLGRQTDIVEFPRATGADRRQGLVTSLRLKRPPIESIDSVIQLHSVGSDDDFADAEGTSAELTLDEQFVIASRTMGRLERIDDSWFIARPRHLRVVYTGGYADPADDDAIDAGGIVPPASLQDGVLQQALLLWSTRSTGGIREVDLGQGGRVSTTEAKHHPRLIAACQPLRRML